MFIDVGIPAPVKGKSKSYDALRRNKKTIIAPVLSSNPWFKELRNGMHEPEALAKLIKICNENRAYHS
jgi:hypothetical protein